MKIYYSPNYNGQCYVDLTEKNVCLDTMVVETQGLLTKLAMHAGIHQEVSPYPIRLARYYNALKDYDRLNPENIFHQSFVLDGMSVAKKLLSWRDSLAIGGWNSNADIKGCSRLNVLAEIDKSFEDDSVAVLLQRVLNAVCDMKNGRQTIPAVFKSIEIIIPCCKALLPDYISPLLDMLETIGVTIKYSMVSELSVPSEMEIIEFSQQYKAEAWLSQQPESNYNVWINSDNKRLDNWLHATGKNVAGSNMIESNPQITQMFLLVIQLFQRPLNVNILLQYLYLPECPLPWELTSRLASVIVSAGGFCCQEVKECIEDYIKTEFKDGGTTCNMTKEQREEAYNTYLPFDLLDSEASLSLVIETDTVNVKALQEFLDRIRKYAEHRAVSISSMMQGDLRVSQLREVANLIDALENVMDETNEDVTFTTIQQWAQSLYEASDYRQYNAQIGSRFIVNRPSNIVTKADNVVWCDFYGDVVSALSTDFLSPKELDALNKAGVKLWNPVNETEFLNFSLATPLHQTTEKLTFIVCDQQGLNILPLHPLRYQLPKDIEPINGDDLFNELPSVPAEHVDNHRSDDDTAVTFDAENHKVTWRDHSSYTALEQLLQNPLSYFMNYTLGFSDLGLTEIKMSLTNGNVAHEVIEELVTAERGDKRLTDFVREAFDKAFNDGLAKRGALLLLPEHSLDRDRLRHQLYRSALNLADIIERNNLKVIECEKKEEEDLGFEGGIKIVGFIDLLLQDPDGQYVVFDLKWTTNKKKHKELIENNRATQLAMYNAMLQQHTDHPEAARTAFFVMPMSIIVSADEFVDCHYEKVTAKTAVDIMAQLRAGYSERKKQISEGYIETSDLKPIRDIQYSQNPDVFPLETGGTKRDPKKAENRYNDFKCFTI